MNNSLELFYLQYSIRIYLEREGINWLAWDEPAFQEVNSSFTLVENICVFLPQKEVEVKGRHAQNIPANLQEYLSSLCTLVLKPDAFL